LEIGLPEPDVFTIAICTRNRAPLLELCLESLTVEAKNDSIFQVLVIDNGSTDETPHVIDQFKDHLSIRYSYEPIPGLSRARNRAYKECNTGYIVYVDDDARIDPGWVRAIRDGINDWRPDYFGGPYRPFFQVPKPAWFRHQYGSKYLDKKTGPLSENEMLSGGNMGWRTSLLLEEGGFPVHLGMNDDQLGVGEESFLQFRLMQRRPEVRRIFLSEMAIHHLVSEEKLHVRYWMRRAWVNGWTHDAIWSRNARGSWLNVPRLLLTTVLVLLTTPIRSRQRYPYWQNFIMDRIGPKVKMLAIVSNRLLKGRHP